MTKIVALNQTIYFSVLATIFYLKSTSSLYYIEVMIYIYSYTAFSLFFFLNKFLFKPKSLLKILKITELDISLSNIKDIPVCFLKILLKVNS
jgi:hypothetical protein